MATEVKIPAMGESISSGILSAWHVNDGDYVEKDQILYELETDKITSEGNAETSGVISLRAAADDEVEIGQVIATIDESATPPAGNDNKSIKDEAPKTQAKAEVSPSTPATPEISKTETSGIKHPLSPAARKAADETGVDTSTLAGSGKDGRVTKADVLFAATEKEPSSQKSTPFPVTSTKRETRKKMSPLRRKIAERLVKATQECALLTTFNEVDMSSVMKLRKQHQEKFVEQHGIKLGFMSFFTKAATHALQAVPAVNARIEGNEIVTHHYYDIGVAVGTDKGLMVPVVRDCDQKDFAQIETCLL